MSAEIDRFLATGDDGPLEPMGLTEAQTRAAYWMGCMPFRTWFTWRMYEDGGKRTEAEWHGLSVALGGSVSAGFIALSSGLVKRDSGVEAAKIWWQSLRPVHVNFLLKHPFA